MEKSTHDVEFVFSLLVFDVLVDLLEPSCERTPPFRRRTVPDENVALVRSRRDGGLIRMPLYKYVQRRIAEWV